MAYWDRFIIGVGGGIKKRSERKQVWRVHIRICIRRAFVIGIIDVRITADQERILLMDIKNNAEVIFVPYHQVGEAPRRAGISRVDLNLEGLDDDEVQMLGHLVEAASA